MNANVRPSSSAGMTPAVTHDPRRRPLPKAPVLDWDDLLGAATSHPRCIADLPNLAYTSSGRAALHAALLQMDLPAGSHVLVPTYHCPTMIAPVIEAGHVPRFYGIHSDGAPLLSNLATEGPRPRVMFVAHYFGLARSLATVRSWCDENGVLLVEDCAHCYFGMAGERPVGHWGDYAITSLSKFFPVPEAGLLGSATRPLVPLGLQPPGWRAQVKAAWDALHHAHDHGRLTGLSHAVRAVLALTGKHRDPDAHDASTASPIQPMAPTALCGTSDCDMKRISQEASAAARWIHQHASEVRVASLRRSRFEQLVHALAAAPGAHVLLSSLPEGGAPYVLPLWVEGADRADWVYHRMRALRLPVFRWDRLWEGTPTLNDDQGPLWSRQVLQLLCHQSLSENDVEGIAQATLELLSQMPLPQAPKEDPLT